MALAGTGGVVHGHINDVQISGRVDAHELDGRVLDLQSGDRRLLERMGVEHLGLGLAAVAALAVPPLGATAINDMARSARNRDVCTGDRDERARPLLVSERSSSLENDLIAS